MIYDGGVAFSERAQAAYVEQGFFYETVAPLLLVGVTSLICISTLTSDIK